jgi:diphthamide biosynthesis protein 2
MTLSAPALKALCLVDRAGKKTYTVLMGKPVPAKLANFPEVEVWVQVPLCPPPAA